MKAREKKSTQAKIKKSNISQSVKKHPEHRITIKSRDLNSQASHVREIPLQDSVIHIADRAGESLVGQSYKSGSVIIRVRNGLPTTSVERVRRSYGIKDKHTIPRLIGMSERTYARKIAKKEPLDAVKSDRLYRLAKIRARAQEVFGDEAIAIDWLKTENKVLGSSPIEQLDTEIGADHVERILTRIEHGVYS